MGSLSGNTPRSHKARQETSASVSTELDSLSLMVLMKLLVLALMMILALTFYLFLFIKAIEKTCMLRLVTPDELTIGDWIAEDVVVGRKTIAGPKDLGIEKEQIEELKMLSKKGRVKKVLIKEGTPFVPSFLVAFLLALYFGSSLFLYFI